MLLRIIRPANGAAYRPFVDPDGWSKIGDLARAVAPALIVHDRTLRLGSRAWDSLPLFELSSSSASWWRCPHRLLQQVVTLPRALTILCRTLAVSARRFQLTRRCIELSALCEEGCGPIM